MQKSTSNNDEIIPELVGMLESSHDGSANIQSRSLSTAYMNNKRLNQVVQTNREVQQLSTYDLAIDLVRSSLEENQAVFLLALENLCNRIDNEIFSDEIQENKLLVTAIENLGLSLTDYRTYHDDHKNFIASNTRRPKTQPNLSVYDEIDLLRNRYSELKKANTDFDPKGRLLNIIATANKNFKAYKAQINNNSQASATCLNNNSRYKQRTVNMVAPRLASTVLNQPETYKTPTTSTDGTSGSRVIEEERAEHGHFSTKVHSANNIVDLNSGSSTDRVDQRHKKKPSNSREGKNIDSSREQNLDRNDENQNYERKPFVSKKGRNRDNFLDQNPDRNGDENQDYKRKQPSKHRTGPRMFDNKRSRNYRRKPRCTTTVVVNKYYQTFENPIDRQNLDVHATQAQPEKRFGRAAIIAGLVAAVVSFFAVGGPAAVLAAAFFMRNGDFTINLVETLAAGVGSGLLGGMAAGFIIGKLFYIAANHLFPAPIPRIKATLVDLENPQTAVTSQNLKRPRYIATNTATAKMNIAERDIKTQDYNSDDSYTAESDSSSDITIDINQNFDDSDTEEASQENKRQPNM